MKRLVAAVLLSVFLGGPLVASQAGASQNVARAVTTSSKGWAVTLAVAKTTVRTGTRLSATITIVNRTGHSVTVEGCQPNLDFFIELANAKVSYQSLSGLVACSTTLRRGTTVIHAQIIAAYTACGGPGQPSCANPNLPVGTYHTAVIWPSGTPHIPEPGRLYISVVR